MPIIGIVAPSSPVPKGLISKSIEFFSKLGFSIKLGNNIEKNTLLTAGTDEERAQDIMNFFQDPEVCIILTTNGGTSSIRTLPLLNYDSISQNHKFIVGYSDTTALQLGIYAKTGMISLTGLNCSDIENEQVHSNTLNSFLNCIYRRDYSVIGGKTVYNGIVTAPLIGGNLTCLLNLIGTSYCPDFSGKVLLIEDVGIEPYLIEGMFSQLYISGILNSVAGVIIGNFTDCTGKHFDSCGITAEDIINFWCEKIQVPYIKDFPYGHIQNRYVLPIGKTITFNASTCEVEVNFNLNVSL